MKDSPLHRDLIGLLSGGVSGAVATGLVFRLIFPAPDEFTPRDHTPEVLLLLVIATFLAGGLVGRAGFNAEFYSDVLPSALGSLFVIGFLGFIGSLDLDEVAAVMGFAAVGIVTSAVVSLTLLHWFPQR